MPMANTRRETARAGTACLRSPGCAPLPCLPRSSTLDSALRLLDRRGYPFSDLGDLGQFLVGDLLEGIDRLGAVDEVAVEEAGRCALHAKRAALLRVRLDLRGKLVAVH